MTRVPNTNYQAATNTQFVIATDDADAFDREDISKLATGVDLHDHDVGRGLPIKRIAAGAAGTTALADGAVTLVKHGTSSVDSTILAVDAVNASHIQTGAVGASEIVDGGVGTAELASGAVTLVKLASGTADRIFSTNPSGVPSLLQLAANMIPAGIISPTKIIPSSFDLTQVNAAFTNQSVAGSRIVDPGVGLGAGYGWFGNGSGMVGSKVSYPQIDATNTPSDTQVPTWNNGAGKFTFQTPAGSVVMTNVVAAVQVASQIPSGWSRDSALDGRMMVFDGTTFSTTWVENNIYGTSWGHLHGGSGTHVHGHSTTHGHGLAGAGISGTTGGPSGTNTTGSTGNTSADGSHTHGPGSMDVTGTADVASPGNTDGAAPGNTDSTSWVIPSRAYVAIKHS